ncbi:hypothetical protein AGABI1DRAFT_132132 [Agaricus bisporus var. burnettii JB137-S8]|uniref:Uncharacterized protein n=1 Tax=Agaricus bisporus var. burnettii (strain JB137-S8 / ATCC MYA-4627 / FGSC 10392) TaxID=597362 RepID=K5XM39_AGABU|nr:uncharacterized protein AGABI1DRAFT_132132 [Agaricus bisporus var. burnettii JB137-S8]EKM75595.1 hypothetical protein AGABI1DRAFT_132132 [Agaricus bisporus var. burnettii JB137-S8]
MSNHKTLSTLNEALGLMTLTTVVGVLYTFSFILYCLIARLLYLGLRKPDGKRQTDFKFILASVIIVWATMDVALNNQYARIIYVDYRSLPGGPLGPLAQDYVSTILHIGGISTFIGGNLIQGVLLWRVWVIYSGTRSRCAIPIKILASFFFLAYAALDMTQLVFFWNPQAMESPNFARKVELIFIVALSVGQTSEIIMTVMIVARLMLIRQKHIKLMGKTDITAQYLGIVAMLIESYTLSTAWNIAFSIGYLLKNPFAQNFFSRSNVQIAVLSYFLVWYRVYSGRAWDRQTQTQLSTLRWERRSTQLADDNLDMEVVNNIEASPPTFSSRQNV